MPRLAKLLTISSLLLFGSMLSQASVNPSIDIAINTLPKAIALSNEDLWQMEPLTANPHRKLWALDRYLKQLSVQTESESKGGEVPRYRISKLSLVLNIVPRFRNAGAWYGSLDSYPCGDSTEKRFFQTEAGAHEAAQKAEVYWRKLVKEAETTLRTALKSLVLPDSKYLEELVPIVVQAWIERIEVLYNDYLKGPLRQSELSQVSKRKKTCETARSAAEDHIEPAKPILTTKPIARSPSIRYQGIFTVRLAIKILGIEFNGRFAIDPSSQVNFISKEWLALQGGNATFIEQKLAAPASLKWRGIRKSGVPIQTDRITLSGAALENQKFYGWSGPIELRPSDGITEEPCCAGVLGQEFLRNYAVELKTDALENNPLAKPKVEFPILSHVTLWSRTAFSPKPEAYTWMEALVEREGLVSRCENKKVIWDFASPEVWKKSGRKGKTVPLECNYRRVLDSVPFGPVVKIGARALGNRGAVLDLSNGRIWIETMSADPVP